MAAPRSDRELIDNKLVTLRRTLDAVAALGAVSVQRLADQPSIGLVIERDLALLLDLARSIDATIATTAASSGFPRPFAATVRAGVVDAELMARLEPYDGPYHVQAQWCLDSAPSEVAAVVAEAVSAFGEYTRHVTSWTSAHPLQTGPDDN